MKIHKYNLNLAGEYRIASELLKRNLLATVTIGNMKGADIFAIGENRRTAVIEVKSSQSTRFVTGLFQKYKDEKAIAPHFWVLYSVSPLGERFFILTHREMVAVQAARNSPQQPLPHAQHAARAASGVDNVLIQNVERFENAWQKILDFCSK